MNDATRCACMIRGGILLREEESWEAGEHNRAI